LESLEVRRLLAEVIWDGGGGDSLWSTPANWDNDLLPTSVDDVIIDSGTGAITVGSASRTVKSLDTTRQIILEPNFNFTALTVKTTSIISLPAGVGDLTVREKLTLNGASATLSIADGRDVNIAYDSTRTNADPVEINLNGGASINIAAGAQLRFLLQSDSDSPSASLKGRITGSGSIVLAAEVFKDAELVIQNESNSTAYTELRTEKDITISGGGTINQNKANNALVNYGIIHANSPIRGLSLRAWLDNFGVVKIDSDPATTPNTLRSYLNRPAAGVNQPAGLIDVLSGAATISAPLTGQPLAQNEGIIQIVEGSLRLQQSNLSNLGLVVQIGQGRLELQQVWDLGGSTLTLLAGGPRWSLGSGGAIKNGTIIQRQGNRIESASVTPPSTSGPLSTPYLMDIALDGDLILDDERTLTLSGSINLVDSSIILESTTANSDNATTELVLGRLGDTVLSLNGTGSVVLGGRDSDLSNSQVWLNGNSGTTRLSVTVGSGVQITGYGSINTAYPDTAIHNYGVIRAGGENRSLNLGGNGIRLTNHAGASLEALGGTLGLNGLAALDNYGTISSRGGGEVFLKDSLDNSGTIDVYQSSTLQYRRSGPGGANVTVRSRIGRRLSAGEYLLSVDLGRLNDTAYGIGSSFALSRNGQFLRNVVPSGRLTKYGQEFDAQTVEYIDSSLDPNESYYYSLSTPFRGTGLLVYHTNDLSSPTGLRPAAAPGGQAGGARYRVQLYKDGVPQTQDISLDTTSSNYGKASGTAGPYFTAPWNPNVRPMSTQSVTAAIILYLNGLAPADGLLPDGQVVLPVDSSGVLKIYRYVNWTFVNGNDDLSYGEYWSLERKAVGGEQNSSMPGWSRSEYELRIELIVPSLLEGSGATDDENAQGNNNSRESFTDDPIGYSDGSTWLEESDLLSTNLGSPFGQVRYWTNQGEYASLQMQGSGWGQMYMPSLRQVDGLNALAVVHSAVDVRQFARATYGDSSSAYVPKSIGGISLTKDATTGDYIYKDSTGAVTRFYGFDSGVPATLRGTFKKRTEPGGVVTEVINSGTTAGDVLTKEIVRRDADGVARESWIYEFDLSLGTGGWLTRVDFRRKDSPAGNAPWVTVRSVEYAYYTSFASSGLAFGGSYGDLRTATIKDAAGLVIDEKFYRYYVGHESDGYPHALKYVFDGKSVARLRGAVADPFAASDTVVAPYSQHHFKYDGQRRVIEHSIQGFGSSTTASGIGTFGYTYTSSSLLSTYDRNHWAVKTVESLPDGNQNAVYTNAFGQVILSAFVETQGTSSPADDRVWRKYNRYDDAGRLILSANPSAVTGHDEAAATLIDQAGMLGENAEYLADNAGLVTAFVYYPATSAQISDTTAGGVTGYDWYTSLQQGEKGGATTLTGATYNSSTGQLSFSGGGMNWAVGDVVEIFGTSVPAINRSYEVVSVSGPTVTVAAQAGLGSLVLSSESQSIRRPTIIELKRYYAAPTWSNGTPTYPLARSETFTGEKQVGRLVTSYAYSWKPDSSHIASLIKTMPVVSTTENGTGTSYTEEMRFDDAGRPVWFRDAEGYVHYTQYDPISGSITLEVKDANASLITSLISAPARLRPHAETPLHLVTTNVLDPLGRVIRTTTPGGRVIETVYDDAGHTVWVLPGVYADTGSGGKLRTTGPTLVTRQYRPVAVGELLFTETLSLDIDIDANADGIRDSNLAIQSPNVRSLSRSIENSAGQVVAIDDYFSFSYPGTTVTYDANDPSFGPATNLTAGGVRHRSEFQFDTRGRNSVAIKANGTINIITFDGLGRPISALVGTSMANLVEISRTTYDNGGIGDGNRTLAVTYPGGGAQPRVTSSSYDWRNREVVTWSGLTVDGNGATVGSAATISQISLQSYDNLSRLIRQEVYAGRDVAQNQDATVGFAGGISYVVDPDLATGEHELLRGRSEFSYDGRSNLYRSKVFSVNPVSGAIGGALISNTWFDGRGQAIASYSPGAAVTKNAYDGVGRLVAKFVSDGANDSTHAHAESLDDDIVLEQVQMQYDQDSNLIRTISHQRFHDTSGTGMLLGPSASSNKSRVSYAAMFYDRAGRLTATANYGTNGGLGAPSWPVGSGQADAPASSDTVLVTKQSYDSAGNMSKVTDPRGIETLFSYDMLGRQVSKIEAWDGTSPAPANSSSGHNRITVFTYNGNDQIVTMTAVMSSGTPSQVTEYVYGVVTTGTQASSLFSNDLLREVRYPSTATGQPSSSNYERYSYNALGEKLVSRDRKNTQHGFTYDLLGRAISDELLVFTGVDSTVRKLTYTYDSAGRLEFATSVGANNVILNQILRQYNGFGQITREYTAHDGAVVLGTTPFVEYAFSEATGGANHSRPLAIKYPRTTEAATPSKTVQYHYGTSGSLNDRVSRLEGLSDGAVTLESYDHLGLGSIIRIHHPEASLTQSWIGTAAGDGGDQYVGLDRFGRQATMTWTLGSTVIEQFSYGYDRSGNRLWKQNHLNLALSELYSADGVNEQLAYDALNRLKSFQRGALSDSDSDGYFDTVAAQSKSQSWSLDTLGNWASVTTNGQTETRVHNSQNQLVSRSQGGGQTASYSYDAEGNLNIETGVLSGDEYKNYDGWNRVVAWFAAEYTDYEARYSYDALGRRIERLQIESVDDEERGFISQVGRSWYYNSVDWQVLEEKIGGAWGNPTEYWDLYGTIPQVSSNWWMQYVWSPVYIDSMVLRDENWNGDPGPGQEVRIYTVKDAQFNTTALVRKAGSGGSWSLSARYVTDPYGKPFQVTSGGSLTDLAPVTNYYGTSYSGWGTFAWQHFHQGARYDPLVGLYHFRNRDYDPNVGRWISQDPKRYVDGANTYLGFGGNPVTYLDPMGTEIFTSDTYSGSLSTFSLGNGQSRIIAGIGRQVESAFSSNYVEQVWRCSYTLPNELVPGARSNILKELGRTVDLLNQQSIADYDVGLQLTALGLVPGGKSADIVQSGGHLGAAAGWLALDAGLLALGGLGKAVPKVVPKTSIGPIDSFGANAVFKPLSSADDLLVSVPGTAPGRVFFVNPAGEAISSNILALQGRSPLAGNFQGLTGASVDEVVSRVPSGWSWGPQRSGAGLRFFDEAGFERIRIHDINPRAPLGSNSLNGWTLRVMDRVGNYYDDLGLLQSGPRTNAGHIPLKGNPNAGR
jgi:RHS repeat-associated protein